MFLFRGETVSFLRTLIHVVDSYNLVLPGICSRRILSEVVKNQIRPPTKYMQTALIDRWKKKEEN